MNVEWKEINPDYIVSSDGQVGSRKRGGLKILKPHFDGQGYLHVKIGAGAEKRTRKIHQLVAEAFLGPRPTPVHVTNHKNGIRDDNRDHNLEWVTRSENTHHRYDILKHLGPRGERHHNSKLTGPQVRKMRARLAAGESQRAVAKAFGVHQSSVWAVFHREIWAHIA